MLFNKAINVKVPKQNVFMKNRALKKSIKQDFKNLKKVDCKYCTAEDCSGCIKQFMQAKIKQLELKNGKSEYIQDYDLSNQLTVQDVVEQKKKQEVKNDKNF